MTGDVLQNIEQIESSLLEVADQLRANSMLTSSEYAMPLLGVIFFRRAANRYYAAKAAIDADQAAGKMPKRPLVKAHFVKRRAMMLPKEAQFDELLKLPKDANLGEALEVRRKLVETGDADVMISKRLSLLFGRPCPVKVGLATSCVQRRMGWR
jgi:hypothetical protein